MFPKNLLTLQRVDVDPIWAQIAEPLYTIKTKTNQYAAAAEKEKSMKPEEEEEKVCVKSEFQHLIHILNPEVKQLTKKYRYI